MSEEKNFFMVREFYFKSGKLEIIITPLSGG